MGIKDRENQRRKVNLSVKDEEKNAIPPTCSEKGHRMYKLPVISPSMMLRVSEGNRYKQNFIPRAMETSPTRAPAVNTHTTGIFKSRKAVRI